MEAERQAEVDRIQHIRESGLKGRTNKSSEHFNIISLSYHPTKEGKQLQYKVRRAAPSTLWCPTVKNVWNQHLSLLIKEEVREDLNMQAGLHVAQQLQPACNLEPKQWVSCTMARPITRHRSNTAPSQHYI
jgi:hypothetical protein